MKRTLLLTALFSLITAAPALADGHGDFTQTWRRNRSIEATRPELPSCDDPERQGYSVIVRLNEPTIFMRMRRIAPPGASVSRCTKTVFSHRGHRNTVHLKRTIFIRVGQFRDPSVAERHATRIAREIIKPYFQAQAQTSINISGGERDDYGFYGDF